ncbi:DUF1090 family protein [Providencia rettgeri]|uniref:DUF1090 family protein n=1 Tax=Providencia rettgeri TaxID=587 RepID=UPI00235FB5A5|nr:DUF1090 family protein [Providencia rettgeri]
MAFIISGISVSSAIAATESCQEQLNDINRKLDSAEKNGNIVAQNNLKIARDKVNTYCTEERQANRAIENLKKKERKLKEKELDLEEAKAELMQAQKDYHRLNQ